MARRDGTGPWGQGAMTGRGFGPCGGNRVFGYRSRCFGRGWGMGGRGVASLQDYKEMLKNELSWVNEELEKE